MKLAKIYANSVPKLLKELSRTPEMLRLRGVGMNCGCEYTSFPLFRKLKPYSRWEHSLGTACIVWHFTGDLTQAAAALFHDIATPTFAHSVDFMRGDSLQQESTEAGTEQIIFGSAEICRILAGAGIKTEAVVDYHRYPIADNASPRLSADRLEYTLGNLLHYGLRPPHVLEQYYKDLAVTENEDGMPELSFRDVLTAISFGFDALKCSAIYVSPQDRYAMKMLSELLAGAIREGALCESDLMGTEPELIGKLKASPGYRKEWKRFRALREMVTEEQDAPETLRRVIPAKKRTIDPLVAGKGRLSRICPEFQEELQRFLAEDQQGWLCAR